VRNNAQGSKNYNYQLIDFNKRFMLKVLLSNMLTLGLLQISLATKAQQIQGHLLDENQLWKVLKSLKLTFRFKLLLSFVWNSDTSSFLKRMADKAIVNVSRNKTSK
jgi:hypothetical protein